jgi:hypothetical protein
MTFILHVTSDDRRLMTDDHDSDMTDCCVLLASNLSVGLPLIRGCTMTDMQADMRGERGLRLRGAPLPGAPRTAAILGGLASGFRWPLAASHATYLLLGSLVPLCGDDGGVAAAQCPRLAGRWR